MKYIILSDKDRSKTAENASSQDFRHELSNDLKHDNDSVSSIGGLLGVLRNEKDTYYACVIDTKAPPLPEIIKQIARRVPLCAIFVISQGSQALFTGQEHYIDHVFNDMDNELEHFLEIKKMLSENNLHGRSENYYLVGDMIKRIAPTGLSVLITGESGTGKEMVAKTIHNNSPRSKKPFIAVNCGAIPETLLESELFGHVKGSFTGAIRDHDGFFIRANGGTLFLDEVAELPLKSQVKLLRALETGNFNPVGSEELKTSDVRILAATNRIISEELNSGRFREDLYYRLGVASIYLEPLRERPSDIYPLVSSFIQLIEKKYNKHFAGFSEDALNALTTYHFPGNARELRNLVENAVLLSGDSPVSASDLAGYFSKNRDIGRNLPAQSKEKKDFSTEMMQIMAYLAGELSEIRRELTDIKEKLNPLNNSTIFTQKQDDTPFAPR
jgi:transcriptional regulator with PAS, ATPase and Fis domain